MAKLQKISDDDYEIIDLGDDQFHRIKLKAAPYKGVVYQYGAVRLSEVNDSLKVSFEYEVFDSPIGLNTNSDKFREYIGHILMTNLDELLLYNKYAKGNNVV